MKVKKETPPYRGMTTQSLLDQLVLVRHKEWRVSRNGLIRTKEDQCPLCALWVEIADADLGYTDMPLTAFPAHFGQPLDGKSIRAASSVMDAADHWYSPDRKELMQALGLKFPAKG